MSICVVTLEAVTDKSLSEPVLPKLIVVATLAAKEVTKAVPTSIVVALLSTNTPAELPAE